MKKNLVKFLLVGTISGLIIPGIASLVVANTFYISMFSQGKQCQKSRQDFKNCAQEITVKVLNSPIWGSGVLIKQKPAGRETIYTVITNAHVLRQVNPPYRIQTSKGGVYEAKLLGKSDDPDLALLQFTSTKKYPVASLHPAFSLASLPKEEEVFAAGYPIDKTKGFVIKQGKISLLLPQAMSDGYQIGFSADIESGMSGGALLNREGEVVGIIGKSIYTGVDFATAYKFDKNFLPTLFPQKLMENSSWAIPIEVAVNKWYSELSSNLAWNSDNKSTPIVSSNIAKLLRDRLAKKNADIINQQQKTNLIVDNDINNSLKIKIDNSQGFYRLIISNSPNNSQQSIVTEMKPSVATYKNYQLYNLDGSQKQQIIVNFSYINNSCLGDVDSFFYSASNKQKYSLIGKLRLRDNYSIDNLDQDRNLEIKSLDSRFACKFIPKYTNNIQQIFLPLQIWKYENNVLIDVTQNSQYKQIHSNHAQELLNYYNQNLDYFKENRDEFKALLAAYLVSKYLAHEKKEGFNDIVNLYTFSDQSQYLKSLNILLQQIYNEPLIPQ